MIRPRPTQHIAAEPLGFYLFATRAEDPQPRTPATCPCGTKLSRYRPLGSTKCAPCEQRDIFNALPEELHPPVLVASERQRKAGQ